MPLLALITNSPGFNGCAYRSINRPSVINSGENNTWINAHSPLPRRNTHRFPIEFQKPIISPVVALGNLCFPGTILGVVSGVVINSFKRVFGCRSWPHVLIKQSEVDPSLAHSYPPSAVMLPISERFIVASLNHSGPNPVFPGTTKSMCDSSRRYQFIPKATARFGVATSQVACSNKRYRTTITQTFPKIIRRATLLYAFSGKFLNGESVKPDPFKVLKFLVGWNLAWDDSGRFDVLSHIVFSRGRFLTGESAFAI